MRALGSARECSLPLASRRAKVGNGSRNKDQAHGNDDGGREGDVGTGRPT